ncbi:hypothetical protein [Tannerella sp.]|uniref:hypothetical protein n=1 Tax=Tannerella sp. TaxID=2382127 RepID=UPI0026DAE558|nr:hypothetical protein [Tannerella sp.]MDO4702446.1 hypothetical protein [Tannerella sp.]
MGRESAVFRGRKRINLSSVPNLIFTVLICLVCWAVGYQCSAGYPVVCDSGSSPVWKAVCSILPDKRFTYLIGCFLMGVLAFIIQRINFSFVIVRGKTQLPFLFFLLFVSTNPDTFPLRPASLALFFLLAALVELFRSYQSPERTGRIFNMSVYLSLGCLIWPLMLWMVPLFWFGMYRLHSLTLQNLQTSVLGILTTFGFIFVWCLWKHDYTFFIVLKEQLTTMNPVFLRDPLRIEWLSSICVVCLTIITYIYILLHEFEHTIRTRQYLSFLIVFAFYSLVPLGLYEEHSVDFLCLFYVPSSMLIAYFFSDRRNLLTYLFYILIVIFLVLLLLVRLWTF